MASIDYMCDVGYAAPPKSVQPVRQATSVVCLFLCYHPPEGGKYRKGEKENEKNVIDGTVRLYGIVPGCLRRLREN